LRWEWNGSDIEAAQRGERLQLKRALLLWLLLCLPVLGQVFDSYGGLYTTSPVCTNNTGFFHFEKSGNQWWLCTPQTHPMFMQGVYVVDFTNNADGTGTTDRQYAITRYGDADITWAPATTLRLENLGFNMVGPPMNINAQPFQTNAAYHLDQNGLHSIVTKMPTYLLTRPGLYSQTNSSSTNNGVNKAFLTTYTAVKDMVYGSSPLVQRSNAVADYYDANIDTWLNAELNTSGTGNQDLWNFKSSIYNKYLIGFACEDSDQTLGFGAGNDAAHGGFDTIPPGKNSFNVAYYEAISSPVQGGNQINSMLYSDTQVKTKSEWQSEMQTKYGTISALNTAWGASYTSFGSSGTARTGEVVGTGDGTTLTFNHTLANLKPSRYSVQIFADGVLVGADDGGQNGANPGNLFGVPSNFGNAHGWLSGTVNYTTGAISVTFDATSTYSLLNIVGTSGVVTATVPSNLPHSLQTGDKVTIAGTTNYNGTFTVTSVGTGSSVGQTFQFAKTGTFAQENTGTFAYAAPISGRVIKVNYVQNGWNQGGTGLMDEDGSHSWFGSCSAPCTNTVYYLAGVNATVKTDLSTFLKNIASHFFNSCRTAIKAWGASSPNPNPNILYLGPDSLLSWTAPSRSEVMQAAGTYLDAIITQEFDIPPQPTLDNIAANYGDKPIIAGQFRVSNADSPYAFNIVSASRSGTTVTLTTDRNVDFTTSNVIDIKGIADQTNFPDDLGINPASASGTTVTYSQTATCSSCSSSAGKVMWDDSFVNGWSSQATRMANFHSDISGMQARAITATGSHPYVGYVWWAYYDGQGEHHNWGIATFKGNLYDGTQNQIATSTDQLCKAYSSASACGAGGEVGNFGSAITGTNGIVNTNKLWWQGVAHSARLMQGVVVH
jgi:hypothetical protein